MSEMVERLVVAARRHMAETGSNFRTVDEGLAGLVRAILTEMREPTQAMLAAAQTAWLADPEKRSSTIWRAMIDEALR